jgi:hypothetical protein
MPDHSISGPAASLNLRNDRSLDLRDMGFIALVNRQQGMLLAIVAARERRA